MVTIGETDIVEADGEYQVKFTEGTNLFYIIWSKIGVISQKVSAATLCSALVRDFNWRMQDLAISRKNRTKKSECSIRPENWRVHAPIVPNW